MIGFWWFFHLICLKNGPKYFHIPIRVNIENCQTPLLNNLKTYTAKFTKFGDGNRSKGVSKGSLNIRILISILVLFISVLFLLDAQTDTRPVKSKKGLMFYFEFRYQHSCFLWSQLETYSQIILAKSVFVRVQGARRAPQDSLR